MSGNRNHEINFDNHLKTALTGMTICFKSSAKGTNISELQNIKIKRGNYNVYTFKQDKYKYIL